MGIPARQRDIGIGEAHQPCLNCGSALTGPYCHACGQKASVHRTLGAFWHDLLHGALHFEGKIWRTLPPLALRPGQLTRRYIDGERARFVSPMALFLFSIFLVFAVFQLTGTISANRLSDDPVAREVEDAERSLEQRRAQLREQLTVRPAERNGRAAAQEEFRQTEQALAGLNTTTELVSELTGADARGDLPAWMDEALGKWRENPSLMSYKLQANSYKFAWLLIPLSIPFVWLLFAWKRRFNGYDHTIFVTYSMSFMTLLFLVLSLFGMAGVPSGWLACAGTIIPAVHLYKQLRGTYGLSRFSAGWRLIALGVFILVVLLLFLQMLVLVGLTG